MSYKVESEEIPTIKKWAEALRSGKYKQGQFSLRKDDKFCCLGVYCDLVDSERWNLHLGKQAFWWDGRASTVDLPPDIEERLGINQSLFMELNDWGVSFDVIASIIENIDTNEVLMSFDDNRIKLYKRPEHSKQLFIETLATIDTNEGTIAFD